MLLASLWAAIGNTLLATTANGLGSCVCTTPDNDEEAILKEALGIPPVYHIATIIQLGYADEVVAAPQRKKLEEIASYQHF